jgi:DNA-binding response OmpR family regulator
VARILVVEDDEPIGRLLESGLRANGYDVQWERTAMGALRQAETVGFDLVMLDLGLPDLDGVELSRELRLAQPATVIVMLTARRDEMDVVAGLESGADDYLTKPFGMVELLARVRAHLRRNAPADDRTPSARIGSLRVDLAARTCWVGEVEVTLRTKEFDLLARLAREPGTALTRELLMSDVWDENWFGSTKTLDVHIAALRRKLAAAAAVNAGAGGAGGAEPTITTLRGHGYRLETS